MKIMLRFVKLYDGCSKFSVLRFSYISYKIRELLMLHLPNYDLSLPAPRSNDWAHNMGNIP